MRARLTNRDSIPQVIADLTLDEKLNLVGAYKACHTLEVPDMDIPAICLMDGVTGVNGVQAVLDYITAPDLKLSPEAAQKMAFGLQKFVDLNRADLAAAEKEHADDEFYLGLVRHVAQFRPKGKQYISFPSGVNIGATFNPEMAAKVGQAAGWELRDSGVDICLGPNVDIARDPLGGRNYEMYGEDPHLVSQMAASFIQGMQSTGVGACAKHFIANNQETNRNTKDTHLSERTLQEIYSRGFSAAVKQADVKAIMSAYNAINGTFTSYNKALLTDLLRDEWGFEGLVVSDWGAVSTQKEDSLAAGMDLILCGPNDMTGCKKAVEDGRLPLAVLDEHVARILKTIVALSEEQARIPARYDPDALMDCAYEAIVEGSVLLKNEGAVLPLGEDARVTFYGNRSRDMLEYGSGSTAVPTNLHSNVYEEYGKLRGSALFETMDGADTLVYTVTAPAGENVDRSLMDIEETDRDRLPQVLRDARQKGLKTVVLLNIAGPVDMRRWIDYADSILCIFIPGCMGGKAAASLLAGIATPSGKLPVTFPARYEDTPSYPNFPGEHNDVYYGEGIFVGYRSYEKRDVPAQVPFGYGLSYTQFEAFLESESFAFDSENRDTIDIPVKVKNTGDWDGSEVIQVYSAEMKPHILRPVKELVSFTKVFLKAGEEKTIRLQVKKESLLCFDAKQKKFVLPVGEYRLFAGTSSADIFAEARMMVSGVNPYALSGESTIGEILQNPAAVQLVNQCTGGMFEMIKEEEINFMINRKLSEILAIGMVSAIPDAVKLNSILQGLYDRLGKIE
jgi:beta-glucosidase